MAKAKLFFTTSFQTYLAYITKLLYKAIYFSGLLSLDSQCCKITAIAGLSRYSRAGLSRYSRAGLSHYSRVEFEQNRYCSVIQYLVQNIIKQRLQRPLLHRGIGTNQYFFRLTTTLLISIQLYQRSNVFALFIILLFSNYVGV